MHRTVIIAMVATAMAAATFSATGSAPGAITPPAGQQRVVTSIAHITSSPAVRLHHVAESPHVAGTRTGARTMAPARITGFTWMGGRQQWKQASYDRLMRSSFTVSGTRFVMRQPDGYDTLVGTISADGTFRATKTHSYGSTGNIAIEVLGHLDWGSTPTMNISYAANSAMSANINNTPFGSTNGKAYRATIMLR